MPAYKAYGTHNAVTQRQKGFVSPTRRGFCSSDGSERFEFGICRMVFNQILGSVLDLRFCGRRRTFPEVVDFLKNTLPLGFTSASPLCVVPNCRGLERTLIFGSGGQSSMLRNRDNGLEIMNPETTAKLSAGCSAQLASRSSITSSFPRA